MIKLIVNYWSNVLGMNLSNEEKLKFAHIMFRSEGRERTEIDKLNEDELVKIKTLYAQKIAYDAVPVY